MRLDILPGAPILFFSPRKRGTPFQNGSQARAQKIALLSQCSDIRLFLEARLNDNSPTFRPPELAQNAAAFLVLLFSLKDSARILSISPRTLQTLIATKQIPVRRIGRRVLIHRKDLEAFARRDHLGTLRGGE
jgi:excisionase family DNA binding protein